MKKKSLIVLTLLVAICGVFVLTACNKNASEKVTAEEWEKALNIKVNNFVMKTTEKEGDSIYIKEEFFDKGTYKSISENTHKGEDGKIVKSTYEEYTFVREGYV